MDNLNRKSRSMRLRYLLGAPLIASMIIPVIIADIWLELYHRVCFPLYGIQTVDRRAYIKIDRQKLAYLNRRQKLNCMYCGYVNGALHYRTEIAGRTEKYRCGIMHQQTPGFIPQEHQARMDFAKYGDQEDFKKKYHG